MAGSEIWVKFWTKKRGEKRGHFWGVKKVSSPVSWVHPEKWGPKTEFPGPKLGRQIRSVQPPKKPEIPEIRLIVKI